MRATMICLLAVVSFAGCGVLDRVPVAVDVEPGVRAFEAGKPLGGYTEVSTSVAEDVDCRDWESREWPFFANVADATLEKLWGRWQFEGAFDGQIEPDRWAYNHSGYVWLEFYPGGFLRYEIDAAYWKQIGPGKPPRQVGHFQHSGESSYSVCGEWLKMDSAIEIDSLGDVSVGTPACRFSFDGGGRLLLGDWRGDNFPTILERVVPTRIERIALF